MSRLMQDSLVVAGRGVRIRHKLPGDALDDFLWRRDPDIARFDAAKPLTATFGEFLRRYESDLSSIDPRRRLYALEDDEGTHLGNIMYYNANAHRTNAEFGMVIGREDYRGRGIGREAAATFIRYLFGTEPFEVIYLHTLEWNDRARKCFEHAGFRPSARVRREAQWFLRMEARRERWLQWYETRNGTNTGHRRP